MASFTTTFAGIENPISEAGAFSANVGHWGNLKKNNGATAASIAAWCAERFESIVTTSSWFSEITWGGNVGASNAAGLVFRMNSNTNGATYLLFVYGDSTLNLYNVTDSGALAFNLFNNAVSVVQVGGTNTLRIETLGGNLIVIKFNGAVVYSFWDKTYTAGQPGPAIFDNSGGGVPALTSFSVGDLADTQPSCPKVIGEISYTNPNPLTSHSANPLTTTGANRLIAFVGYHPQWTQPAGPSINLTSISDSKGNLWTKVAGPTNTFGPSFSMTGSLYTCNAPINDAALVLTVTYDNACPCVLQIFAVSGVIGVPTVSIINATATGVGSTIASSPTMSYPANSLIVGWAKNEGATLVAVENNGFTLDGTNYSTILGGTGAFIWGGWKRITAAGSTDYEVNWNVSFGWQAIIASFGGSGGNINPVQSPRYASQFSSTIIG